MSRFDIRNPKPQRPSLPAPGARRSAPALTPVERLAGSARETGGFTLVELLVTIAITGIMLVVVNQVFTTVSDAVGVGIATSEILTNARAVGDQFDEDAEYMLGPDNGGNDGVLVIINQVETNRHIIADDIETNTRRNVRTDQMMFIRDASGMEPIAPGQNNSFNATSNALFARIWYGHCLRTNAAGTAAQALGSGTNNLAGNWILGRQALFLDLNPSSGNFDGAWYTAIGYSALGGPNALYKGIGDVAEFGLGTPDTGDSNGCMVAPSSDSDPSTKNSNRRLYADAPASEYADRAYAYMFLGNNRLWVNPIPDGTGFESWKIGQMHAYFAGHVSDFIVEFAGDYNGDSDIDTDVATGEIEWYGLTNPPPTDANGFTATPGDTSGQPYYDDRNTNDRRFVFRHGSTATGWPHLIRIRYRMHDSRGKVVGVDGDLGRWFEYVLKVNRD